MDMRTADLPLDLEFGWGKPVTYIFEHMQECDAKFSRVFIFHTERLAQFVDTKIGGWLFLLFPLFFGGTAVGCFRCNSFYYVRGLKMNNFIAWLIDICYPNGYTYTQRVLYSEADVALLSEEEKRLFNME